MRNYISALVVLFVLTVSLLVYGVYVKSKPIAALGAALVLAGILIVIALALQSAILLPL